MTNSKHIAQLIGPTLVALTLSEALNLEIWSANVAAITYLNGCILFVAGLSIIRVHNRWTLAWPVVVTLVGWGAVLGGLARMFAPYAHQGGRNALTYALIMGLLSVGIFLSVRGYVGRSDDKSKPTALGE